MAKLTFTADFADSPFRVAYDISERLYVVVEVATGDERNWFERGEYQAAYAEAAGLNTESAEAPTCELCGGPAVLVGEQLTCPECAPIAATDLAALVPDPDAWVAVSAAPCEPADFRPVTTYLPDMVGAAVTQTGPDAYRALWMGYYVGEPFATYGAAECEAVAAWAKANPSTPDLNYYGNSTGGFDGGADIDPDGDDEDEWPARAA